MVQLFLIFATVFAIEDKRSDFPCPGKGYYAYPNTKVPSYYVAKLTEELKPGQMAGHLCAIVCVRLAFCHFFELEVSTGKCLLYGEELHPQELVQSHGSFIGLPCIM